MDKKIKVLHIIGALNFGGAETMAVNILRNIDRSRFQFDFYLSGNDGGYYEQEVLDLGGRIINIGRRKKHPLKYCVQLFMLIRKEKYDVVQIHATDAMDGLPAFVSFLAGAEKRCLYSHNSAGQSVRRQKLMRAVFMPFVTHPQACSDIAAQWMFGKKAKKAEIIPLPIDCEKCLYDKAFSDEEKKKLGLSDYKIAGHIGRFQKQKNHRFLIDIFSELVRKDPQYRLVLIGTGQLRDEIDQQIRQLGLEEYIVQMGQVASACRYMSMFDVFLLPSYYEGFPTVILESQANGLHSVISSTITPSIAITDLVHFMDLDAPAKDWADCIISNTDRQQPQTYNDIIKKDYSLKSVAEKYERIYSETK